MSESNSQYRVLLVEDDNDIRGLVNKKLSIEGHEVHEADNGIEALNLLDESTYDLLVVDMMMPKMDGYNFLKSIKDKVDFKKTPVLVFTNVNKELVKDQCLALGVAEYCIKVDTSLKELAEKVKRLLGA